MPNEPLQREPEFRIEEVAAFIGKSVRWLRAELARDAHSARPILQLHGRIGRTLVWTQAEAEALRKAIRERHRAGAAAEPPAAMERVGSARGRGRRSDYVSSEEALREVLNWRSDRSKVRSARKGKP